MLQHLPTINPSNSWTCSSLLFTLRLILGNRNMLHKNHGPYSFSFKAIATHPHFPFRLFQEGAPALRLVPELLTSSRWKQDLVKRLSPNEKKCLLFFHAKQKKANLLLLFLLSLLFSLGFPLLLLFPPVRPGLVPPSSRPWRRASSSLDPPHRSPERHSAESLGTRRQQKEPSSFGGLVDDFQGLHRSYAGCPHSWFWGVLGVLIRVFFGGVFEGKIRFAWSGLKRTSLF